MDDNLRHLVRRRAESVCEYCLFPEEHSFNPFQIDYIIAQKHGGPTVEGNLAWSCYYCNTYKGLNIAGWISSDDTIIRLYHPQKDDWDDHFEWQGSRLTGKTPIGQVTIDVLRINHPDAVSTRQILLDL